MTWKASQTRDYLDWLFMRRVLLSKKWDFWEYFEFNNIN